MVLAVPSCQAARRPPWVIASEVGPGPASPAIRSEPHPAGPGGSPREVAPRMNPTAAPPSSAFDATSRPPARFRAALDAFLSAIRAEIPAVDPIVTSANDAWMIEGFAADQSVYARLAVSIEKFERISDVQVGTANVALAAEPKWPVGWLRGFAGLMAALSLPSRRVAIDRGGLFGLLSALGPARTTRASRSIEIHFHPGRAVAASVLPGARPVPLHARISSDGPAGSIRVAVGHGLASLAGLLPWVDSADLFLLGPGLPSCWTIRLGGIELMLGLPGWTPDGRLGSLSLDPVEPPVEPGRFLANQVVATFRNYPAQSRAQVVERTRGTPPEVAAVLVRLAGLGQLLPDPASDLFHWRAAWDESVSVLDDDPEPAEVTAARGIVATTSIEITRDEIQPGGGGRRVEGTILDRPVTLGLDPDGWIKRGRCDCTPRPGGGLRGRGPCRHLLALQARLTDGSAPRPATLDAWFAGFPAPLTLPDRPVQHGDHS